MHVSENASASLRPPTLLALPSYLAGSVARLGNKPLVDMLKERGLALQQFAVLVALSDFGPLAPHELSTRLATDRSHISTYVEALARREWVTRTPDVNDRRRVTVTLNDAGRRLVEDVSSSAARSQASFFSVLTATEQRAFRALMMKIILSAELAEALGDNQTCESEPVGAPDGDTSPPLQE
ncbi:MarR family winged helix-turn-helix transcriptional regulator [Williamsia sterculiae]|uniref:DNA-binding transcriptional regulator, MarR family n=1 Tax=Williamsia sterculiae TaxID=1344003 RepID=A0A1N7FWK8_9NOCA|nr:MarR family transcriptional regulator [Williamsia sterculiae]SIS04667.1 DNA-binding transcriptional regulator, MarR family [Williamsia sterculiae]